MSSSLPQNVGIDMSMPRSTVSAFSSIVGSPGWSPEPSEITDTHLSTISRKTGIIRGPRAALWNPGLSKFWLNKVCWITYTIGGNVVMAAASAFRLCMAASTGEIVLTSELSSPGHMVRLIVLSAISAETIRPSSGAERTILRIKSTMLLIVVVATRRTGFVTFWRRLLRTSSDPRWIWVIKSVSEEEIWIWTHFFFIWF